MEEIEQSGAQAKLDVQTLAERCEREPRRRGATTNWPRRRRCSGTASRPRPRRRTRPCRRRRGAASLATDLDSVYAALDEAEEEYEAAEVPEKGAVVQRIRKRCMGVVFMAGEGLVRAEELRGVPEDGHRG